MRTWSGTAKRLFFAFAGLILVYGIASYLALRALAECRDGMQRSLARAQDVRLSLELASAVRDQYAHQAHTIIIGDDSHLGFYGEAEQRVRDLTARVRQHAQQPDELQWVSEIEKSSAELDHIFRDRIVPAVLQGKQADVHEEHARAQQVVMDIEERVDRLVERFEQSIAALETRTDDVSRAAFRWMLVFLLGAPVFAIAVGIYVGRSVARPVALLQEGAARLARGDLETRIALDTPDEFGDLARQFNSMTAALKENQEKLVQHEKLAGIGRLAAGVAHEINNPLGVIRGYTRLLAKKAAGPLKEDLEIIDQETQRCQEIVEGLLDLSRPLNAGLQPVDLRELCDEVVARLGDSKQLDGVRVSVEGGGSASGQPQKLRQVILNLVKNAAEAAGKGGEVRVRVARADGAIEVSVADSGPGIAEAARGNLFEPFFTTKPQGTGMGLAVSRAIARAHGGEVLAGAAATGGALFTLRLPARASS